MPQFRLVKVPPEIAAGLVSCIVPLLLIAVAADKLEVPIGNSTSGISHCRTVAEHKTFVSKESNRRKAKDDAVR